MRQSTLLFGRGAGSRAEEGGSLDRDEEVVDTAAPPTKKPRRAAASKSEERSKKQMQMQMQMTLAHNGKLHRRSVKKEKERSPPIELGSTDEEIVVKKKIIAAPAKAIEPMSLQVKGTMTDPDPGTLFLCKEASSGDDEV